MSWVYFIGPKDLRIGRVKIGFTSTGVRGRLASLQTGSPYPLGIYAYVEGTLALERALHEAFSPLRLQGEWFSLEYKLLSLVCDLIGGPGNGDVRNDVPFKGSEFYKIAAKAVSAEYPPMFFADHKDDWRKSADGTIIKDYFCEVFWKEYCEARA